MTTANRPHRGAEGQSRGVTFLASVTSLEEARLAAAGGVDIVDAKDPAAGALGALPLATIRAIRTALPGIALSATVGDPLPDARATADIVAATAATGVDFVKIGFNRGAGTREAIARIGALALPPCRLVAVLIADRGYDTEDLPRLAAAGFAGVMLDTDDKLGPPLPELLTASALHQFIASAGDMGLFAGLAGSLRLAHIPALKALRPDVLGFRGALCVGERREGRLDAEAIQRVGRALRGEAGAGRAQPTAAQPFQPDAVPLRAGATMARRVRERVS